MREKEIRILLEDREFVIKKLPAARGYAILVDILTKALPLNLIGGVLEDFVPASLLNLSGKQQMTMEEMEALQLKLLASVSEQLPAGATPILDSQGNFKVEDLEDNMLLFGQLLMKTVEFQYKDFFLGILSKMGITLDQEMPPFDSILNGLLTPPSTSLPQS